MSGSKGCSLGKCSRDLAFRDAVLELDGRYRVTGRFRVACVPAVFSTTRVGALLAAFACGLTPHPSPLAARALGFPRRLAPGEGEPLTSRALGFGRSATSVKRRCIGSGWQPGKNVNRGILGLFFLGLLVKMFNLNKKIFSHLLKYLLLKFFKKNL